MNKRGQFYIIMAVLLILVLIGLAAIVNKATVQPNPSGFFDLSKDYEAETSRVIDYGVYNKYSPSVNISEKVKNITEVFAASAFAKDPNVHLVFIYGNKEHYIAENISSVRSTVSWSEGGSSLSTQTATQKVEIIPGGSVGQVNVSIAGNKYNFTLGDKDNFYFIIQTTAPGGEKNIAIRE